ncbi:MAG TPA: orotate phosphoribosyltransferase, partial [Clostridia bacterium]|nr:orotate phosphoribosyltransferase [Clostridia bacterium]
YGMAKGVQRLKETNVQNISLTDFDTIIEVACEKGYIKQNDKNKLLTFRDNPSDEGWIEA